MIEKAGPIQLKKDNNKYEGKGTLKLGEEKKNEKEGKGGKAPGRKIKCF